MGTQDFGPSWFGRTAKTIDGDFDVLPMHRHLPTTCDGTAYQYAQQLRARGTRVFIFVDPIRNSMGYYRPTHQTFSRIAAHTGGALLPFTARALPTLLEHFTHGIRHR